MLRLSSLVRLGHTWPRNAGHLLILSLSQQCGVQLQSGREGIAEAINLPRQSEGAIF